METRPILVWINCYGGWAPDLRHPVETIGYNQYLDAAVTAILPLKNRIRAIHLSGGMKDASGKTECETTKPELGRRLGEKNAAIPIQIDNETNTSPSIVKKFLETWQAKFSDCIPLLFVDSVRAETNAYSLKYYSEKMGIKIPDPRDILILLPRLDNHPHSTAQYQAEKLLLMQEKGVDFVENQEIEQRKTT